MESQAHEEHHQNLEARVTELERIVKAATTPPSVPPAQPEPVKPPDAA